MIISCPKCQTKFDNFSKWGPKQFCSRACANSRGPRSDDFKKKVSVKLTGRKISTEQKLKITGERNGSYKGGCLSITCLHCNKPFATRRLSAKFCSKKCWSDNIQLNRTAFENYKAKCLFTFDIFDYPEYFDLSLIKEHGWYSPSNKGNNLDGVSKDHKYSVKQGFIDSIDPYYISHPANCDLILHRQNQKKRTKCSLTFEDLKKSIEEFECKRGGKVTQRSAKP